MIDQRRGRVLLKLEIVEHTREDMPTQYEIRTSAGLTEPAVDAAMMVVMLQGYARYLEECVGVPISMTRIIDAP